MDQKTTNLTPKHLLFFLVFMSSLFFVVCSGSDAWLFVVQRLYPDESVANYNSWQSQQIGLTLAQLLVSMPLALFFGHLINRELRLGRLALESRLRAWMIYIIMAFTLFGLISAIYDIVGTYFDGTMTTTGFLNNFYKAFVNALILGYFGADITRKDTAINRSMIFCTFGIMTIVLVSVSIAIIKADSPDHVRKMRHDNEVAGLFGAASESINTFTERKGHMPSSWADVARSDVPLSDKTPEYFEYKKTGDKTYELCATFHFDSEKTPREYKQVGQFYKKGRYCAPFQTK